MGMSRLTEIEARLEAASSVGESFVSYGMSAELIANAPTDLRYLLERVRELEAQLHETKIALRFAQIYAENALEYATDQTMIARHGTTGRLESHD